MTDDLGRTDSIATPVFDEYFVSAALLREPPAVARPLVGVTPPALDRPARPVRPLFVAVAVVVALLAAAVITGSDGGAGLGLGPGGLQLVPQGTDGMPTPRRADSQVPLGVPPPAGADSVSYVFTGTQPDSGAPVAYDPCRPVPYVVNTRTMPADGELLVHEAVAAVQQATGLQFRHEGSSDEVPTEGRSALQPDRYGDRWPPVLVAWSDDAEVPALAGDVAGIGGSLGVRTGAGPTVYVTGMVALDGPQLRQLQAHAGRDQARAVVMHELAHVVGLAHVDDPGQLMNDQGSVSSFGAGDLAGLARLGAGECVEYL